MPPPDTVNLVLCWHMHQPDYRDHIRDEFRLPWVYLHAIKDYIDMAAHLENTPDARAVVNFSPVLLEQLIVYENQIGGFLDNSSPIRDPLLAALASSVLPTEEDTRIALVKACLRINRERQVVRFPHFTRLVNLADLIIADTDSSKYMSNQFLADLVTWYHIAWLGECIRRNNSEVVMLIEQGSGFTLHQRRMLLQLIREVIVSLRTRYSRLAQEGQVELAMSPCAHPMLPLLLDLDSASEAQPDIKLPLLAQYPGGRERVDWHLQQGLSVFREYFGAEPAGCWPSEGGVSDQALEAIGRAGFQWAATGESVLANSIARVTAEAMPRRDIHGMFRHTPSGLSLFARDDGLSDLIGFTYADWHADDAVANLIYGIEVIASQHKDRKELVISIIMDGENAWEYYPENGYYFLSALYRRLAGHPFIRMTTYSDVLDNSPPRPLDKVVAGSWVYGNFATWIGDEDKNRAWDILGDAKNAYDRACRDGNFDESHLLQLERQLAACEGSDWFWWFGDYNPAQSVSDFESLYRIHLANLYQMLGVEPPQYLTQTIAHGSGSPVLGGVIRRGKADDTS